jgi:4-hydroxybenzoate polyprenyltransferase
MNILFAFFRLIRFNNLIIMLVTQVFSYYFLSQHITLENLLETRFIFLCIATIMTAAGGYIINDYLDVKLDLINKPSKVVVGHLISRRWAMFLHLMLNSIALGLGLYIGTKVFLSILIAAILLWIYSVSLKQKILIGNLLVSVLSAFVIIINYVYDISLSLDLILGYSFFAFSLTLIREIIKDTEDMRGDKRFNCKTIPIVLGVRKTKSIVLYISLFFTLFLIIFSTLFAFTTHFMYSISQQWYIVYMLLGVFSPLLLLFYLIKKADTASNFSRISLLLKCIMILGMFSMVWARL